MVPPKYTVEIFHKPGIYGIEISDKTTNKNRFFECDTQYFAQTLHHAADLILEKENGTVSHSH